MARLEIPSIVVHHGSNSAPGSPTLERTMRGQRSLCKQTTFDAQDDVGLATDKHVNDLKVQVKASDLKSKPVELSKSKSLDKPSLADGKKQTNGVAHKAGAALGPTAVAHDDDAKRNGAVDEKAAGSHASRVRPLAKMKLLQRSHAMREETSPPPDPGPPPAPPSVAPGNNNSLSVRPPSRHRLSRQGSSRESADSGHSPCLSRENSAEQYTDFTGADLELFIVDTINKNHKDRALMMQIESQLVSYIRDRSSLRQYYKFPAMSSYQRMLVHRVAAYFGMEHNVDQPGNCVVVSRTKSTRIPHVGFKDYVKDDVHFPDEPRRSILKRDSGSFEDGSFKSPERHYSSDCRRSKSFEEREEEYEKARRRIFTKSCDEGGGGGRGSPEWEFRPWGGAENDQQRRTGNHLRADSRGSRMLKVESFEGGDTLKAGSLRGSVSKSYSFGGYSGGGGGRVDVGVGTSRTLTKQDSGSSVSSRVSPSSSGYKSQSQRSDATLSATPSPTATPLATHGGQLSPDNAVMWAVSDMAAVPPGSLLIDPATGQALTNPDGSVYRFDPKRPPRPAKPEESKNAGTQVTPERSRPNSPAPPAPPPTVNQTLSAPAPVPAPLAATATCPSKSTTTTSTSPSFPVTPPPAPPSEPFAPPAAYQHIYKAAEPQPAPLVTNAANASQSNVMGAYPSATGVYSVPAQQVNPALMYNNGGPSMACHSQQQCSMVYPGYGGPYDPRQMMPAEESEYVWVDPEGTILPPDAFGCPLEILDDNCVLVDYVGECFDPNCAQCVMEDGCGMSVPDLNTYFMGMNVVSDQQRGAGDSASQPPSAAAQGYPTQPGALAQGNGYCWQPHQPGGMPMYYTVPHPSATPMLTSSPPAMGALGAPPMGPHGAPGAPPSPRYVYSSYGNGQIGDATQAAAHNGGFMPANSYALAGSYGAPAGSECMAPPGMMYAPYCPPTGPGGHQPGGQFGGGQSGPFRAPTPPQTPTHGQPMCGPSYVYLNGGGGPAYAPAQGYGGGGGGGPNGGPSPPGPAQYLPVMSGLFRPSMQMMRSSPPPPTRPPRDNSGPKPTFARSPSTGGAKERPFGADQGPPRYPPLPVFRVMPGDIRGLVGPPLQAGVRMPFPLPPHHPNPRGGGPQHYAPDSRARKPRPKSLSGGQSGGQPRPGGHPGNPSLTGSYGVNNATGRMSQPTHGNLGNGPPVKHH